MCVFVWPFSATHPQRRVEHCMLPGCDWLQDTAASPCPQTPHHERGYLGSPQPTTYTHTHTLGELAGLSLIFASNMAFSEPRRLGLQSRLTILVSAAFVSGATDLIISTGQSLLSVIFCRSLKLESTFMHTWFSLSVCVFLYFLLLLFPNRMQQFSYMHFDVLLVLFILLPKKWFVAVVVFTKVWFYSKH